MWHSCDISVPCGCRFEAQLPHFQSSFLLNRLGRHRKMTHVGDLDEADLQTNRKNIDSGLSELASEMEGGVPRVALHMDRV